HTRDVARREVHCRLRAGGEHQRASVTQRQLVEQREETLGLGRLHRDRVDHAHHALAGTGVERRLTGELTHLLRQRGAVVTRRRTEHHATTPPVRGASGTLTRTTSALLLPRLLVAARDFLAALGL